MIGLEAQQQMEMAGEQPDVVVGCVGGGSNYAGISYPFMAGKLRGETPDMRFLATEPAACPTLTKGRFAYDYGDTAQIAPIVPMYTLGHDFVPAPGARGRPALPRRLAVAVAAGASTGTWTPSPTRQNEIFEAGLLFAKAQGILPAPEAEPRVKGAIDEAIAAREAGEERVILFNLVRPRALRHAGLRRLPGTAGFPTSSSTPPTRTPRSRTCPRCRSRSERGVDRRSVVEHGRRAEPERLDHGFRSTAWATSSYPSGLKCRPSLARISSAFRLPSRRAVYCPSRVANRSHVST